MSSRQDPTNTTMKELGEVFGRINRSNIERKDANVSTSEGHGDAQDQSPPRPTEESSEADVSSDIEGPDLSDAEAPRAYDGLFDASFNMGKPVFVAYQKLYKSLNKLKAVQQKQQVLVDSMKALEESEMKGYRSIDQQAKSLFEKFVKCSREEEKRVNDLLKEKQDRQQELAARDKAVAEREVALAAREVALAAREEEVSKWEQDLSDEDAILSERERRIEVFQSALDILRGPLPEASKRSGSPVDEDRDAKRQNVADVATEEA